MTKSRSPSVSSSCPKQVWDHLKQGLVFTVFFSVFMNPLLGMFTESSRWALLLKTARDKSWKLLKIGFTLRKTRNRLHPKKLSSEYCFRSENSLLNSGKWSPINKLVAHFSIFRSTISLLKRISTRKFFSVFCSQKALFLSVLWKAIRSFFWVQLSFYLETCGVGRLPNGYDGKVQTSPGVTQYLGIKRLIRCSA